MKLRLRLSTLTTNVNAMHDIIEIFSSTSIDAEIVKSMLKGAEIEAFLKDNNIGTLVPWYASSGGAGAVKVMISSIDYERAKLIIEQFEKNRK
jgi:hypothetical protein